MSDIIIVILVIMPVLLVIAGLNYSHKKRKRKAGEELSAYLYKLTNQHGINHSFRRTLVHQLILIDGTSRKLIVVNHRDNQFTHEMLSLDAIKSMKVTSVKQAFPVDEGNKRTEVITTQIGVEISFSKPDKELFLVS